MDGFGESEEGEGRDGEKWEEMRRDKGWGVGGGEKGVGRVWKGVVTDGGA